MLVHKLIDSYLNEDKGEQIKKQGGTFGQSRPLRPCVKLSISDTLSSSGSI